jgi:energy-coupling factor transporter ATP-binding protein EcfA2
MNEEADEVLNGTLRAGIDVKKKVELLSVAQKQLIEIAKAIMTKARIIVMDEPTSSLTSKDIDALFQVIRDLKRQGTAVVYISHRMEEISKIGDRVTSCATGNMSIRWTSTKPILNPHPHDGGQEFGRQIPQGKNHSGGNCPEGQKPYAKRRFAQIYPLKPAGARF